MALTLKLDDIKPLLSAVGLGDAPNATPKPVDTVTPPPMAPPGPPAPTPAAAGFMDWKSDPQNQQKITSGMTPPNTPIIPPAANPPQMAFMNPPQQQYASLNPPNVAPPAASTAPPAGPAPLQSFQDWSSANPDKLAKPMFKGAGKLGTLLNLGAAGTIGAAGGLKGDPTAGANWVAQRAAEDRAVPDVNQSRYNAAVVQPAKDARSEARSSAESQAEIAYKKSQTAALDNKPDPAAKPKDVHQLYADAVSEALGRGQDPNKDPKVAQLSDAITSLQRVPASKDPQRDDRAIQIYAKPAAQRSPEENSYLKGYEQYVKTTKTDPGVARTSVMLQMPTAIADPDNPGGVIYSTRAGAIGKGAPTSIETKTAQGVAKDFTSGPDAKTLTNINTADAHIQQLAQISKTLQNGDVTALNKLANAYKEQTGAAAPMNFQLLKTALAAEIGKTTSGGVATVEETKEITKAINAANSPDQLAGVMATAQGLMHSKREQLQGQYTQGMQGKANFGGITPPPTGGAPVEGTTKLNSHGDKIKFSGGKWGPA